MSAGTILIVDDERTLARAIKAYLEEAGYETVVAGDAESALGQLAALRPDVVFTDVRLPGMDGIATAPEDPRVRSRHRGGRDDRPRLDRGRRGGREAGGVRLSQEAARPRRAEAARRSCPGDQRAQAGTLLLPQARGASRDEAFGEIIGGSPVMQTVLDQARQIAALDESPPVLITGETGTGKGLVARTIHASGPRAAKPFIDVNCTALPATLMEAELFGHERGAFTDAKESKLGLFEAAEGGFIFLDEIGDVELPLQGKLLKAIEDRVVRRVGGVRDRKIDVRILAATNRDLGARGGAGSLPKGPLLPPGGADSPPAAAPGAGRRRTASGRSLPRAGSPPSTARTCAASPPRPRALLRSYPWPGNVRELSHVIERAVLWSRGPEHTTRAPRRSPGPASHSPARRRRARPPRRSPIADRPTPSNACPRGECRWNRWEKSLLEQALRESAGNQTRRRNGSGSPGTPCAIE